MMERVFKSNSLACKIAIAGATYNAYSKVPHLNKLLKYYIKKAEEKESEKLMSNIRDGGDN